MHLLYNRVYHLAKRVQHSVKSKESCFNTLVCIIPVEIFALPLDPLILFLAMERDNWCENNSSKANLRRAKSVFEAPFADIGQ